MSKHTALAGMPTAVAACPTGQPPGRAISAALGMKHSEDLIRVHMHRSWRTSERARGYGAQGKGAPVGVRDELQEGQHGWAEHVIDGVRLWHRGHLDGRHHHAALPRGRRCVQLQHLRQHLPWRRRLIS